MIINLSFSLHKWDFRELGGILANFFIGKSEN